MKNYTTSKDSNDALIEIAKKKNEEIKNKRNIINESNNKTNMIHRKDRNDRDNKK